MSVNIVSEFLLPEFLPALGFIGVLAALMAVPETTMDKNHCSMLRKYDVRLAWKLMRMKPEAVTHLM